MNQSGKTAIKVIVVLGVLAFAGLYLSSTALRRTLQPNERERVLLPRKTGPFDGRRAYAGVETILAFGPRPSGSAALAAVREYLSNELRRAGLDVREHSFTGTTAGAPAAMTNLIAVLRGASEEVVVIGTHFDTLLTERFVFTGANSSAAGSACLLELARALAKEWRGRTLYFVWFDGEESDAGQPHQGSRKYVEQLRREDALSIIRAVISVSAIGDCYLALNRDPEAPEWLMDAIWDQASYRGYGFHFGRSTFDVPDSHTAFRDAGLPSIALLDPSYGGSRAEHSRYWRSAEDTIGRICPESLQAVGDVLYDAIWAIDRRLDASPEG